MQMTATTSALTFAECASILEHRLRSHCGKTHTLEPVQRRCEKGVFLRSKGAPSLRPPCAIAYPLRKMAAWKSVKVQVGVFFEGIASDKRAEEIRQWVTDNLNVSRYKWSLEGPDLFIRPRSRFSDTFTDEMFSELERLGAALERRDEAVVSVYVEVHVPYGD